jgi:alpha-maltose-1-phosphate synthase
MTPALFYVPEAYSTGGPKLMGRNAAGESFLRGFLAHSRSSEFLAVVHTRESAAAFAAAVRESGCEKPARVIDWLEISKMAGRGPLFNPDPDLGRFAWQRAASGDGAWSLCGITHTLSSHWAMDAVIGLLAAPVQPWDALICTSRAGRRVVENLLGAQAEYLRDRFAARRFVMPMLPIIPLGIHTDDFAFVPAQRAKARGAVGADADTLVVLYAGRLSFHAKAHPLPMYLALEKTARALPGRRILLVEFGQHATPAIAAAFTAAAHEACPSVTVRHLHGGEPGNRDVAWACADVFCSFSDNIQETFGITPVEAMAAGLPVVVSDWDGYRDTVRHGRDGFRVPTLMPAAGAGEDLAWRHAVGTDDYDFYCCQASALVAVSVEAAANALTRLLADAGLRARMGAPGRRRAVEGFDWAAIIPRYEALWASQEERRLGHTPTPSRGSSLWPGRMDPFRVFAGYATQTLAPGLRLCLTDADAGAALSHLARLQKLSLVRFATPVYTDAADIRQILEMAGYGSHTAAELVAGIPGERRAQAFRSLTWLLKFGLLTVAA